MGLQSFAGDCHAVSAREVAHAFARFGRSVQVDRHFEGGRRLQIISTATLTRQTAAERKYIEERPGFTLQHAPLETGI